MVRLENDDDDDEGDEGDDSDGDFMSATSSYSAVTSPPKPTSYVQRRTAVYCALAGCKALAIKIQRLQDSEL